jgi:hypothetical protein
MRTKEQTLYRLTFEQIANRLFDENSLDSIVEKMSVAAKRRNKLMRRKPEFKRKMKKKKKCQQRYSDRIKSSDGKFVCNIEGRLVRGMKKMDRIRLKRTRKKNRARITIK